MAPTVNVVIVTLLLALASVSCGGDDEAAQAPTTSKSDTQIIRETERERIHALVVRDIERARSLHADDFVLTAPNGDRFTKDEYLEAVRPGRLDYVVWDPISPIQVRVQGDKATVRYRSKIGFAGNFGGTTEQTHTDTYGRREGLWQIVRSVTE
jgi:Domain of unknown function (DUF4440)